MSYLRQLFSVHFSTCGNVLFASICLFVYPPVSKSGKGAVGWGGSGELFLKVPKHSRTYSRILTEASCGQCVQGWSPETDSEILIENKWSNLQLCYPVGV